MKKQIRRNVFETNSSSCHSLIYGSQPSKQTEPNLDNDKNLIITGRYFGWDGDDVSSINDKIEYWFAQKYPEPYDDRYVLSPKALNEFAEELKEIFPQINEVKFVDVGEQHIDHQSIGELGNLTLKEFLLEDYIVEISNDN